MRRGFAKAAFQLVLSRRGKVPRQQEDLLESPVLAVLEVLGVLEVLVVLAAQ